MYIWTIPATENNVLSLRAAKGENGAMTTMTVTMTMTMTMTTTTTMTMMMTTTNDNDSDNDDDDDRGITRAYRL